MSEDSLLERVTAAAEERQLSQNSLLAYRRTWLKIIAWAVAEGVILETLPREGISMRMPPGPKHFASSSGQTGHPYRGHRRFENGPDFMD